MNAKPAYALARPEYVPMRYVSAGDLRAEQQYHTQRQRRHQRYLHDWGVLCGLWVVPADAPGRQWAVQICPGYAVDCCGEEIEITAPTVLNLRDYLWLLPVDQSAETAYICIRYAEEFTRPVAVVTQGCGCDRPDYRPSRIQDSYQLDVRWTPPASDPQRFDLCSQDLTPCPSCPEDLSVILACVHLPAHESTPITSDHIEHRVCRRQFSSSTLMQQQVRTCCCIEDELP